ncbi:MAG: hypothetical protein KAW12_11440 [Candidatus Aminicenantes bacterium]|nr:hypothetical protein [Candidatus Aminicenantes bacterium]
MKKKFDCVEMKHKNAQKIVKKTGGFSKEEELDFWKKSTNKLINTKSVLKKKHHRDMEVVRPEPAAPSSSG